MSGVTPAGLNRGEEGLSMSLRVRFPIRRVAVLLVLLLGWAGSVWSPHALADPRTEANITRLTASLLARSQLSHRPLDRELADRFLDRYFDSLDPERVLLLKSDVVEFAPYRGTLARETLRTGASPVAHAVFQRFLERARERAAYVEELLRASTFDFTGNDAYTLDRSQAQRPADAAAARVLWRQRLRADYLQHKLEGEEPEEIRGLLSRQSARVVGYLEELSRDQVLEIYLSALARVYDPHSDYLGHRQMEELSIAMNLSLFGIGARLQSADGRCKIVDLVAGGPAMRSGELSAGDWIVAVAQDGDEAVDVVNMSLSRIVSLIRGPKGTVVHLTVVPAEKAGESVRRTVRLVRDEIKLEEQRASGTVIDLPSAEGPARRIAVIDLPSFYADLGGAAGKARSDDESASATADVERLLRRLQAEGVEGIVLDLRRNGGGSLDEAIKLGGLFIAEGPIVQTRGLGGAVDVAMDPDPSVVYSGPLVVLTSRTSASASEIVAGALQDYGRAVIVGDASTYGKGTVQSIIPLEPMMRRAGLPYTYDPGALKVTIRKFYRPGGESTQLKGVVPDIVVPAASGVRPVGEAELDNPLPWDAVPAAHFDRLDSVTPHVAALRARSAWRVRNRDDFARLQPELERLRAQQAEGTVSLNEATRREELARLEERRKAYREAIELSDEAVPVTYSITLRDENGESIPPPGAGAAMPVATATPAGESEADSSAPGRDVVLEEAQRILTDYMALRERTVVHGRGSSIPLARRP
jgi:carboxyl-terminal processing protease